METYSIFREIADSWGLLGMVIFFVSAILMLFRPGAKQQHKDASMIPFRDEPPSCNKNCDSCPCKTLHRMLETDQ